MSIRSGEYSTSGVYGSSYYGWKFDWIPLHVTLMDADFKAEVESPSLDRQPVVTLELEDSETGEVTTIASSSTEGGFSSSHVRNISITRNAEFQSDSFTISFTDARRVDPRLANDLQGLLDPDITLRVRVNVGLVLSPAKTVSARVFTGIPMGRSGVWAKNGSSMTLSGHSLTYILLTEDGTTQGFTGSISGLIMDLLGSVGFNSYVFGFDDRLITEETDFISNTVEDALKDIFEAEKDIEWVTDAYGTLTIRDATQGQDPEFAYTTGANGNILELTPSVAGNQVVTEVNVIGGTAAATLTYVDSELRAKFGRRTASINSVILQTAAEATQAAVDLITKSRRRLRQIGMKVPTNPLIEPLMPLSVVDAAFGSGYSGNLVVLSMTMNITPKGITQQITGEFDSDV